QRRGERGHVHVLAAGVDAADPGERVGVLRDEIDLHWVSSLTALTTCSLVTCDRHGCPGTGQARALLARQGACWSPGSTAGTPYGAHRSAGTTGANRLTTGVPTAAARWAGPVFPATSTAARSSTAASSANVVRPPRSTPSLPATKAVSSRSWPVTTTRCPSWTSSRTASRCRSAGQARAGAD